MKVAALQAGQLYTIDADHRIVVVVAKGNLIDVVKARRAVRWKSDKRGLKGRPALYCGTVKRESQHYLQGWYRVHKFLINGEVYFVHGESMRNILPLTESS
tara:strand:+ start:886 stop:1188 length:303 start_codon:yes stop_codon:yes gene_type:complete